MNFLGAVKSVFCLDVNPTSTHQKFGQACSDSSFLGSKNKIPGFSAHGSLSIYDSKLGKTLTYIYQLLTHSLPAI